MHHFAEAPAFTERKSLVLKYHHNTSISIALCRYMQSGSAQYVYISSRVQTVFEPMHLSGLIPHFITVQCFLCKTVIVFFFYILPVQCRSSRPIKYSDPLERGELMADRCRVSGQQLLDLFSYRHLISCSILISSSTHVGLHGWLSLNLIVFISGLGFCILVPV